MVDLFTWTDFKLPKVIFRKLGKHRAWGYYHKDKIHIDERLTGKQELEILIHEFTHFLDEEKSEDDVRRESRKLTEFLWSQGYRKVDNKE